MRSNPSNNYLTTVSFDLKVHKSKWFFDSNFSVGAPQLGTLLFTVLLLAGLYLLMSLLHFMAVHSLVADPSNMLNGDKAQYKFIRLDLNLTGFEE